MERNDIILYMRRDGRTVQSIASEFNITYQRVIQILQKLGEEKARYFENDRFIKNKKACPTCKNIFYYFHSSNRTYCSLECFRASGMVNNLSTEEMREYRAERNRKYRKTYRGNEIVKKMAKNQRIKFPNKIKARALVNYQLQKGLLVKPEVCSSCKKAKKLDAHHKDYEKPLDVTWICRLCHFYLHKKYNNDII